MNANKTIFLSRCAAAGRSPESILNECPGVSPAIVHAVVASLSSEDLRIARSMGLTVVELAAERANLLPPAS